MITGDLGRQERTGQIGEFSTETEFLINVSREGEHVSGTEWWIPHGSKHMASFMVLFIQRLYLRRETFINQAAAKGFKRWTWA